jgi:hypothetical protein
MSIIATKSIKVLSCHSIFDENALALSKKYNWPVETDFSPNPNDVYILFGANAMPHVLLKAQTHAPFKIYYIILNSEQIESPFLKNKNYIKLLKDNCVFNYSNTITKWLETNINIEILGSFYFPFIESNYHQKRENDVVFVGSRSTKREVILDTLKKTSLVVYSDFEWKHSSPEDLTNLLNKSKVVINIPYYNNNSLETHRIIKALSCGCDVISLRSSDEDLDRLFENYIYFTNDIISEVTRYFNNELKPKKSYEELIVSLDSTIGISFINSINNVIKTKL